MPLAQILPADVPWRINASSGVTKFAGTEGTFSVWFTAFFGEHEATRERMELEAQGIRIDDEVLNKLGMHEVELHFPSVSAIRVLPSHSSGVLLDEGSFDWSALPLRALQLKAFSQWQLQHASLWAAGKRCPDPRFYQVLGASFLAQLELTSDRHKHWIVLGHDISLDIIADKFLWNITAGH